MASNTEHDSAEVYRPDPASGVSTIEDLLKYVQRELNRVSIALDAKLSRRYRFLTAAPSKVYEGLTTGADGTHWNPGGGKGVYTYYSGAWNKLG